MTTVSQCRIKVPFEWQFNFKIVFKISYENDNASKRDSAKWTVHKLIALAQCQIDCVASGEP